MIAAIYARIPITALCLLALAASAEVRVSSRKQDGRQSIGHRGPRGPKGK